MLDGAQHPASGRAVAGQFVGDHYPGHILQPREQLAKELGRGSSVPPGGDQDVQDSAVLIYRPPQVVGLPADLDEYLVEVPLVPRTRTAPTQSVGVGLPELRAPLPHCLVAEGDPTLGHHLLDLTETQREAVVQPDAVADDLRREAKSPVRRRTDGHQTSSSPEATRRSCQPPDHEVDSAHVTATGLVVVD